MAKFTLLKETNSKVNKKIKKQKQKKLKEQQEQQDSDPPKDDIKQAFGSMRELQSIAKYWAEHGEGLSEDEIREKVGLDLEQLEYSPEQQAEYIPKIMDMIDKYKTQ